MKLKLFNGTFISHDIDVLGGGYDSETGKVTLIVRSAAKAAGTIQLTAAEMAMLAALHAAAPKPERVEAKQ